MIKCVDFSADPPTQGDLRHQGAGPIPPPRSRTSTSSRCSTLFAIASRRQAGPRSGRRGNWLKNANLVVGGDFRAGQAACPAGLGRAFAGSTASRWAGRSSGPRAATPRTTSAIRHPQGHRRKRPACSIYSKLFPDRGDAKYRFQCRYRTNGPSPKVFIKCYDDDGHRLSHGGRVGPRASGKRRNSRSTSASRPSGTEAREVYRSQQNLKGAPEAGTCRPRTSPPSTPSTRPSRPASCFTPTCAGHRRMGRRGGQADHSRPQPRHPLQRSSGTRWRPRSPSRKWKKTTAAATEAKKNENE